jgi:hypothetical protein
VWPQKGSPARAWPAVYELGYDYRWGLFGLLRHGGKSRF